MKNKYTSKNPSAAVRRAASRFIARRERQEHPQGTFDNGKRWYPAASEGLDTTRYRSPSRAFPYSYMRACRTLKHCARLEGVSESQFAGVRRLVREIDAEKEATLAWT